MYGPSSKEKDSTCCISISSKFLAVIRSNGTVAVDQADRFKTGNSYGKFQMGGTGTAAADAINMSLGNFESRETLFNMLAKTKQTTEKLLKPVDSRTAIHVCVHKHRNIPTIGYILILW